MMVSIPSVSKNIYDIFFSWMPTAESCQAGGCQPPLEGLIFYSLILFAATLVVAPKLKSIFPDGSGSDDDMNLDADDLEEMDGEWEDSDGNEDSTLGSGEETEIIKSLKEVQKEGLAPPGISREYNQVRVGDCYRRHLHVSETDDFLEPGLLRKFFVRPNLQYDMSIHITPLDRELAKNDAEDRAEALEADVDILGSSSQSSSQFAMSDKLQESERASIFRDEINEGQRPFEYSIYLSVRGDDKDELDDQVGKIRDILEREPTDWTLDVLEGQQMDGFKSTLPLAHDEIDESSPWDPNHVTVGTGIGSIYASMSESRVLESSGIEIGEHAHNGSPLIKDPFKSQTNYNQVVIGDTGSGKSFDSKMQALRTWESRDDTMLIMLDPLKGFQGLAEALDADHIVVGGDRGFNPLDIKQPSEEVRDSLSDDYDLLGEKQQEVLEFFDNFFAAQDIDIENSRPILGSAIRKAYENADITKDISTHDRPSPIVSDVIDVLDEMSNNPGEYAIRGEDEEQDIARRARALKGHLRLFEDGQYENLNQESDFDLRGEDVVYVDLSQQESQSSGGGGLMMQLMFSIIYERAKQTPKNVVFVIDEARFLMKETNSLEFLGQRVRHSRHFNTSIRFITQNIGDFFSHEEAESIINNSFMFYLHRTNEIHEWKDEFGINDEQAQFVEEAETGSKGYSEALVRVNDEWFPVHISALEREAAVVDFDAREDDPTELPGLKEVRDNPVIRGIQRELRRGARQPVHEQKKPPLPDDKLSDAWGDLTDTQKMKLDLLNGPEMMELLRQISEGSDPQEALNQMLADKISDLVDLGELASTKNRTQIAQTD